MRNFLFAVPALLAFAVALVAEPPAAAPGGRRAEAALKLALALAKPIGAAPSKPAAGCACAKPYVYCDCAPGACHCHDADPFAPSNADAARPYRVVVMTAPGSNVPVYVVSDQCYPLLADSPPFPTREAAQAEADRLNAVPAAGYSWESGFEDEIDLMRDGKHVGAYRISTGAYYPRVGPGFGPKCRPPVAVPADPTAVPAPPAAPAAAPTYYFAPPPNVARGCSSGG